jgi:hypothetical protein
MGQNEAASNQSAEISALPDLEQNLEKSEAVRVTGIGGNNCLKSNPVKTMLAQRPRNRFPSSSPS